MLEVQDARPVRVRNGVLLEGLVEGDLEVLCQEGHILRPEPDGVAGGAACPAPLALEQNVAGHADVIDGGVLWRIQLPEYLLVRQCRGLEEQKGDLFGDLFLIPSFMTALFNRTSFSSLPFLLGTMSKEIVLIGRSNVGKSTLFWELTGTKVRIGKRPGITQYPFKTKVGNVFYVDMPGYGFMFNTTKADQEKTKRPDCPLL